MPRSPLTHEHTTVAGPRALTVPRPSTEYCGFDAATAPFVAVEIKSLMAGVSPRLSVPNIEHTRLLAGIESPLPPIIVHRARMRVIDGTHRVRAAMLRGETTIRAQFFDGTDEAAFLLAVRSNVAHGLPLTMAERKAAARRILVLHSEWSNRAVAATTGLSDKTVASVRRESTADVPQSIDRLGSDGRVRPLDGAHRRRVAAELIVANPQAPLRQIASASGLSLGTIRDVRARVNRGEDPAATRPRRTQDRVALAEITERSSEPSRTAGFGLRDRQQQLAILEQLRRDPSLRFSASGRNAVRLLYAQMAGPEQWCELVTAIPEHWAGVVADLARGCADSWQEFAAACDHRARRVDER